MMLPAMSCPSWTPATVRMGIIAFRSAWRKSTPGSVTPLARAVLTYSSRSTSSSAERVVLARTTRSALLEVLREEYVKTARAKGVTEPGVLFRHALRNAMIPILTVAGVQLGQLMAGSIILESVFYLPGLGRLALGAISARDLPVVQGVVLFVASGIVAINALVDVLYGVLDPRIRYE